MWKCPNCETINKDDICVVCGEHKPVVVNKPVLEQQQSEHNREQQNLNSQGTQRIRSTFTGSYETKVPSEHTKKADDIGGTVYRECAVAPETKTRESYVAKTEKPAKGKGGKIALIIVLCAVILAVAAGGIYLFVQNSEQQGVESVKNDVTTARELFEKGEYAECLEVLSNSKSEYSQYLESFDAVYLEGNAYMMLERYNDAILCFENALKLGETTECYINLAVCYARTKDYESAEAVISKVKNDDEEKLYVEAEIKVAKGEWNEAINLFESVIDLARDENLKKRAYIALALLYKDLRHNDKESYEYLQKQIEVMEEAVRTLKMEDDLTLTELMGEAYFTSMEYELAIQKFQRLIELGYDRDYIYVNIAIIYQQCGKLSDAEETLLKMKEKYPENYQCYVRLAFVYIEMEGLEPEFNRDYSKVVECYEFAKQYAGANGGNDLAQLERLIGDLRKNGWIE